MGFALSGYGSGVFFQNGDNAVGVQRTLKEISDGMKALSEKINSLVENLKGDDESAEEEKKE